MENERDRGWEAGEEGGQEEEERERETETQGDWVGLKRGSERQR